MPAHPLVTDSWTAGAQRVWAATLNQAMAQSAHELAVEHLLAGLVSEESRAAEQLERVGITPTVVEQAWGSDELGLNTPPLADQKPLPRHELLELVLIGSPYAGIHWWRPGTELGTEHFPFGLSRVASDVSPLAERIRHHHGRSVASQPRVSASGTMIRLLHRFRRNWKLAWHDPTQTERFEVYRILDAAANRARASSAWWKTSFAGRGTTDFCHNSSRSAVTN
ncbi:MAG: Clp protease N-terminal domain-containing protein [Planctomycetaceae bacterium]